MDIHSTEAAVEEAKRFLVRAEAWLEAERLSQTEALIHRYYSNPKLSGALKRSSLDLTRALAELRAKK